ncbi:MAG TPA: primary-amine oxidase [Nitrolancea sp.]|nr:primary-amine oxidase [Nitrolancea sp.]
MDLSVRTQLAHPLTPLSVEEIEQALGILRAARPFEAGTRVASVALREPPKAAVLAYPGEPVEREAAVLLLDKPGGAVHEAVVSLSRGGGGGELRAWRDLPGVQPPIMGEEFASCEAAIKADPRVLEALARRGVTDLDLVMVDPWSAGYYGGAHDDPERGRRLVRALCWVRPRPGGHGYAHPIDNLAILCDLNTLEVIEIEDFGVVPVPQTPGEYAGDSLGPPRADLKPLEIHQPEGPSFQVDGYEVRWQKWHFRVGFTPREGLVLHTLGYQDGGRERPILYRASLAEMVVPYGDPHPAQWRKNAFDAGEYAIGTLVNSLELGCDCLGEIHYFDAALADGDGRAQTVRNAICLHEEDAGILWKHLDFRTGATEVRRSRRLVISWIATVGNYEYGFYWYLYQDGTITFEIKLTGIVSTGALPPGERTPFGQLLSPDGLYGPIHQHFFSLRLDLDIDGPLNSVYEIHTESVPLGPETPHGNAYRTYSELLESEQGAQRVIDPLAARYWKVVNPNSLNAVGEPVGYRLLPHSNVLPFAQPSAAVMARAGFMAKHLWVTPYAPDELYAAGEYPNQHPGGAGLPAWTAADRSVAETDVVLWYTLGSHHPVRLEDWPVMPVQTVGFTLQPQGFFDANPALDVPPSPGHGQNGHC